MKGSLLESGVVFVVSEVKITCLGKSILLWANELKKTNPSLASLILCAEVLTEDEKKLTLVIGNSFHQRILSGTQATKQLLEAAIKVGLPEKRLEFLTAAECEKEIVSKETVIQEVWENLV